MNWLLHKLLGVDPAPWARGGSWHLETLAAPRGGAALLVLALLAAGAWGAYWLYSRESRQLSWRRRTLMSLLRLVALLGVTAMLLEPVLVFERTEMTPSHLIILVDDSASMGLPDAYANADQRKKIVAALALERGEAELAERTRQWLARRALSDKVIAALAAGGDRIVHIHRFAGQMDVNPTPTPAPGSAAASAPANSSGSSGGATTQPAGDTTAIGLAIRQALAAYRGLPLAGILLVSDGRSNAGPPFVDAAAAAGAPIVALAVGTPEGPRNAKVLQVEAGEVAFVGDPMQIKVLAESRAMAGAAATVTLSRRRDGGEWEDLGKQELTLGADGQVVSAAFADKHDKPALIEYRATLATDEHELTLDDNTGSATVRAVRAKLRVLLLAGSSFSEVQFLRATLMRDKGVSMSSWLQTADSGYEQPGELVLNRLPLSHEEMDEYDCVVLYDPDPALWPAQFPGLLEHFVAQAGGGLVYIAGERNTTRSFDHQADPEVGRWVALLPVIREPGLFPSSVLLRLSAREAWKLDVTAQGRADPVFHFLDDEKENGRVIDNLPGMYWHFPVTRAKPGATVLARHGDPRMRNDFGPHVLLATHFYGPGRVFFVGFDSTYRWRYLDEKYFDGFWARMIDRAGRAKRLGGRYPLALSTDKAVYSPDDTVTLTAAFTNPADAPAAALEGQVEEGAGAAETITLTPSLGQRGAFTAGFTIRRAGTAFIRVWPDPDPAPDARPAVLQVKAEPPNLEYENPTLDRPALEAVARALGGKVLGLEECASLPDAFAIRRSSRLLQDHQELWHAPLLAGVVVGAMFLEWILRKVYRLI